MKNFAIVPSGASGPRPGPILRERLSRALLMNLPRSTFVVSNGYSPTGGRLFAEPIGATIESRSAQWARARLSGAAGRLCTILWSEEHFAALTGKWRHRR
jgi:hypothetical protein